MRWRNAIRAVMLIMAIIGVSFSAAVWAADDAPRITKEQLKALLENPGVIILDARVGTSWSKSDKKIKGAVRVDPGNVGTWADSIPKSKKIVVYCS
jgi:rhodanese-related sulfurtransferase